MKLKTTFQLRHIFIVITLLFNLTNLFSQNVYIPDANFKSYLVNNTNINTNGDTEIQISEAAAYSSIIQCENYNITDLTGIEAFTSLQQLFVGFNPIANLDLSANTALTSLFCGSCSLTSLDVSNNTALTYLRLDNNNISVLDVTNNTLLTYLRFNSNNINTIDISNNTALTDLICYSTGLNSLDVSNNTALNFIACSGNNITSLDFSNNASLGSLTCSSNNLEYLNLANGNNTNIYNFNSVNNPNLSCIEVDDVNYSTTNWTNIDSWSSFNLDCTIYVDSIFIQGQNGVDYINTDGGSLQMEATVLPANAHDLTYTWSVTNVTGEATIDANGLLSATANGIVTVLATANDGSGVSGNTDILITNQVGPLVNSITVQSVNGDSTISVSGGSLQMEAIVLPTNANDTTYSWSVVNLTGAATIDVNGLLTAVADGTVEVIATANDASGVTGSKIISISNQTVGIKDIAFNQVNIYPNPTADILNIELDENVSAIQVYDVTGKMIKSFNANERKLNVSELNTGIYLLEIQSNATRSLVKFVKK